MNERMVTKEERQTLLSHPELVMFDAYRGDKNQFFSRSLLTASITIGISMGIGAALCFTPFAVSHPGLIVGFSIFLMIFSIIAFAVVFDRAETRRIEKERQTHYIDQLKKKLPEELFVKTIRVTAVVIEKCEGKCIDDGKEQWFSYSSFQNVFVPPTDADLAVVTDHNGFCAFIKRDSATESFYL